MVALTDMLGSRYRERTSASESEHLFSLAFVTHLLSSFYPSIPQDDLRVPTTLLPALVASPLQLSLLLLVTSRALGQRLPTQKPPPRGTRTYDTPSFPSLSFLALHPLFNLHRRHPRGRPYHTKPRPSRIMYLTTRGRIRESNQVFFSSVFVCLARPPFCFPSSCSFTT